MNVYLNFAGSCREAFEYYRSVFGGEFEVLQTFADAPPDELQFGNNFSISLAPASKAEADRLFTGLSAGGEVEMAMQETFWGSYFGSCTDRFGVSWMINHDLNG